MATAMLSMHRLHGYDRGEQGVWIQRRLIGSGVIGPKFSAPPLTGFDRSRLTIDHRFLDLHAATTSLLHLFPPYIPL